MKKLIFILLVFLTISCGTVNKWDNLSVYKRERVGETGPAYLIIKDGSIKQCELVYLGLSFGYLGNYLIKEDTLFFYPKYEYFSSSGSIVTDSVPEIFLIKGDSLIHLMDDPFGIRHEEEYIKME